MILHLPTLLAAFLFGLFGSIGHCATMCGGVQIIFSRRGLTQGWRLPVLHIGRILTYVIIGFVAGTTGDIVAKSLPQLALFQGLLALLLAVLTGYFAVSLVGRAPSPEQLFTTLTRRWSQSMRALPTSTSLGSTLSAGMLWGLLPCGFMFAALIPAASSGSGVVGGATMLVFGLGTWSVLLLVHLLAENSRFKPQPWARSLSAMVVMVFAIQLALRGLAAWSVLPHAMLGRIMLW